ncbi:MAG: hypothetical protein C0397_19325 [Odoribacter sp.]|nr:hypothetical protein [Odoribacter sp.]
MNLLCINLQNDAKKSPDFSELFLFRLGFDRLRQRVTMGLDLQGDYFFCKQLLPGKTVGVTQSHPVSNLKSTHSVVVFKHPPSTFFVFRCCYFK